MAKVYKQLLNSWELGFSLGNTVKYISRAGKKESDKELQDLKKAMWYLQHHIEELEKKAPLIARAIRKSAAQGQ